MDRSSVVVSGTPAELDDDDPRFAVAKARGQKIYGKAMPPSWITKTVASLDLEAVRTLAANGLSAEAIDRELDKARDAAPAPPAPRAGACALCGVDLADPAHGRRHAEALADDPLLEIA